MPQHQNREAWMETRAKGLGASEVAAAVGMSPWESRYRLWAIKTGRIVPLDNSQMFRIAYLMEPVIANIYKAQFSGVRTIVNPGQFTTKKHPEYDWLFITPDFYQNDPIKGPGVLEVKTTGEYMRGEWVEGAPLHYQIQLQVQLACSGRSWGTLAAIIGGNKFVSWDYDRDEAFIEQMLVAAQQFWNGYVIGNYPPPIDWMPSTRETIERMHPKDSGETLALPVEFEAVAKRYDEVKADLKELEKERALLVNQLKAGIGGASFATLGDGTGFSLKWWEKQGYKVERSEGRTLRRTKPKEAKK